MRAFKKAIAAILFLAILAFAFFKLNQLFFYKNFYNQVWPTTSGYANFYKMKKNTIDVLFFGSSLAITSFYPQELYNKYHITSYNLGCEQQNLLVSYYWLMEAIKYQSPKVVVVESRYLVHFNPSLGKIGTGEGLIRKPIDPMKWSHDKLNAVRDICIIDESQKLMSYIIPSIRFHNRWKYLNEDDFSYRRMIKHEDLMGSTITKENGNATYIPFSAGSSDRKVEFKEIQKIYLDKIIDVCQKRHIKVMLCRIPDLEDISWHNTISAYAKEKDVRFLDFNEKSIYATVDYDVTKDGYSHPNRTGAVKITNHIGKILSEEFGLQGHIDEQYEKSDAYYRRVNENFDLAETTDINEYLEKINRERYSVFISARDDASEGLSKEALQKLSDLGLRQKLNGRYRSSYYAVISGGKVVAEKLGNEKLSHIGSIRNGKSIYKIESAGHPFGNISRIEIDGKNHSKNRRGLNIVVYDDEQKKVIDSVCFDTHDKNMPAHR